MNDEVFQALFTQPVIYETTLVLASVVTTLGLYLGWLKIGKPLWEAKTMKQEREKVTNKIVADYCWWSIKNAVQDGQLSVDEGAMYVRRLANTCLPDILPGRERGAKNLKELLQEKQTQPMEVKEEPAEVPTTLSLLARLSAAKKAKAA